MSNKQQPDSGISWGFHALEEEIRQFLSKFKTVYFQQIPFSVSSSPSQLVKRDNRLLEQTLRPEEETMNIKLKVRKFYSFLRAQPDLDRFSRDQRKPLEIISMILVLHVVF